MSIFQSRFGARDVQATFLNNDVLVGVCFFWLDVGRSEVSGEGGDNIVVE